MPANETVKYVDLASIEIKSNESKTKDNSAPKQQNNFEKQSQDSNRVRKTQQRIPSKQIPKPELLESADAQGKTEKVISARKRGRPRKPIQPPGEKKKLGRPKDETKCNITCYMCGKFFKHHSSFLVHERTHFGIKEFECEYCHKKFVQKGQLTLHRRIHTGEKPCKCPHCPESFRVQALLDSHIYKHTGQGTNCSQCQSIFPTPAQAKQHIRDVHSTDKSYVCQICGQSYKMGRSLRLHLESHDKRICAICGKVFTTVHALKTHRRTHEMNHKCNYCSRSFKSKEKLHAHNKLRGRVYQCDICCYSFNKAEFLRNHNQRNHWKELDLQQLPRKNVQQRGNMAQDTPISSAEKSLHAIKLVEPSSKQSELSPLSLKFRESGYDKDYAITDENKGIHFDNVTFKQEPSPQIYYESKKCAPGTLPLKPTDFIKKEIYQQKDTQASVEVPTELIGLNINKDMCFSVTEDDEVPLAKLFPRLPVRFSKPATTNQKMNPPGFPNDYNTPSEGIKTTGTQKMMNENGGSYKTAFRKRGKKCQFCDEIFYGQVALREHKKTLHPNAKQNLQGPVICEICGKFYKTLLCLTVHRGQHEKNQRFKCDECPKAFVFQSHLTNHKRMDHRQERHICSLCGKQYKYTVGLRHHLLRHEDKRPFKCDKCSATFTHSTALHAHKAIHSQQVFTCTICEKSFRFASSLRVHKRLHNRDNYIRCDICAREFSEAALLKKHMAIHSVDREVKCIVCDKVYYKKSELLIHQAKEHTNHPLIGRTIKVHSCNLCGVEFTKESHQRTHSLIHKTEYSFKCDMCEDKKFKQKTGLRNHLLRFHKVEPAKKKRRKQSEADMSQTLNVLFVE